MNKSQRFVYHFSFPSTEKRSISDERYISIWKGTMIFFHKFLVSKETVVLRWWERSKQKFGFIKRVDKGEIIIVKDLESYDFLSFV